MITHDPIQFWAAVQPERVALRSARSAWTYALLDHAVWASADLLLARGLGSGEHLSLEFEPDDAFHFAVTFHALHRLGLLPVPISPHATPTERQALRDRANVDVTLTAADFGPQGTKAGQAARAAFVEQPRGPRSRRLRSEEHTSELQSPA